MHIIKILICLLFSSSLIAQTDILVAKRADNKIFLEHKVSPKENWYSIGRKYEISPREIAPFNGLTMEKGLSIGQVLKIPLIASNFNQETSAKIGVPVVHLIAPKEGLFRVANDFGVSIDQLKKWNNLNSDQVKSGGYLTIGFLKASSSPRNEVHQTTTANNIKVDPPVKVDVQPEQKTQVVIAAPKVEKKLEENKVADIPAAVPESPAKNLQNNVAVSTGTGYFSGLFNEQSKEGSVQNLQGFIYGVFKSTSGWEDAKYYVLLNEVVPGTIVKILLKGADKAVFAKVLGSVPVGKESDGMTMRMSNATASALGISDTTKDLMLTWYK
jgi:LysM repeat protein